MTKETKVGLLIGLGIILLIGIVVSDHLSKAQKQEPASLTDWAPQIGESISPNNHQSDPFAQTQRQQRSTRTDPIPLPGELGTSNRPQTTTRTPRNNTVQQQQQRRNTSPGEDALARRTRQTEPRQIPSASVVTPGPAPSSSVDRTAAQQPSPVIANRVEMRVQPQLISNYNTKPILHKVQNGETLYEIANLYYGSDKYWVQLRDANPRHVTVDGRIQAGTTLTIPHRGSLGPPQQAQRNQETDTASGRQAQTIEVKSGQTLSEIAQAHLGGASRWPLLLKANRDQLRSPEQLRPGMKLRLPTVEQPQTTASQQVTQTASRRPASAGKSYVVRDGDTLSSIAKRMLGNESKWDDIFQANRRTLRDPDDLTVGMELTIPKR